jgi:hypothetical protein
MRTWLVAFVLSAAGVACAVPADANRAQRCGAHGTCPNGALCLSGFCLPTDRDAMVDTEFDTGTVQSAGDAEVGSQMPPIARRDAGSATSPPQPAPDAGTQPVTPAPDAGAPASLDAGTPDAGTPPGSPDCGALGIAWCCAVDRLVCNGHCVNPLKDRHHCGGCAIVCSKGPCKAGICTKDEDDD